jgi:serine/threonine protein kinase
LELAIQVTETLHEIHEQNVCHLDLKPDNIFITKNEKRPIIGDFGLAAQTPGKIAERGSKGYIAPELFGVKISIVEISPSADIWSLGVVLYTIFHGENPFTEIQETGTKNQLALEITKVRRKLSQTKDPIVKSRRSSERR